MYRRHIRTRFRVISRRTRRFIVHNLLHVDDPPERLGRGVALGLFIAISPYLGLHLVMVILLAWALRANKATALAFVWVSNPFTFLIIYPPCYVLGAWMLGSPDKGSEWWKEWLHPPEGFWNHITFFTNKLMEVAAPLILGTTVGGLVVALVSYYATIYIVRTYRMKRWGTLIPPSKLGTSHPPKGHAA